MGGCVSFLFVVELCRVLLLLFSGEMRRFGKTAIMGRTAVRRAQNHGALQNPGSDLQASGLLPNLSSTGEIIIHHKDAVTAGFSRGRN